MYCQHSDDRTARHFPTGMKAGTKLWQAGGLPLKKYKHQAVQIMSLVSSQGSSEGRHSHTKPLHSNPWCVTEDDSHHQGGK